MITLLAGFLVSRYAYDLDDAVLMVKKVLWYAGVALVLLAVLLGAYCGRKAYINHKIAQRDAKLEEVDKAVSEGRISAGTQDTETPKKEAQNASKRSNEAIQNVNTARSTDSRNFNADDGAARERFCRNYPTDSECQPR
jgi:hypothetical protein